MILHMKATLSRIFDTFLSFFPHYDPLTSQQKTCIIVSLSNKSYFRIENWSLNTPFLHYYTIIADNKREP